MRLAAVLQSNVMSARRPPRSPHLSAVAKDSHGVSGEYPVTGRPRRFATVQMDAVEPAGSTGRMLDDDLGFDFDIGADGALELDSVPSSPAMRAETSRLTLATPPRRRATPSPMARVTPRAMAAAGTAPSRPGLAAVDPHAALVAFAGFGEPPVSVWKAPAYAVRVITRRRVLRAGLALARTRRAQDVGLYEASLRTADDATVRSGLLVMAGAIAFLMVLIAAAFLFARGAAPTL
jgi:hypothetical protein